MKFFWLGVFLLLIFVFIQFQIVWLAVLVGVVIIVDMISTIGGEGVRGVKAFGKGLKEDMKREYKDVEKAAGSHPDGEMFVSLFEGAGKRFAEGTERTRKEVKPRSENIDESFKKIGKGSKEFIKASKKIFKE